jgi:hypothetical protein
VTKPHPFPYRWPNASPARPLIDGRYEISGAGPRLSGNAYFQLPVGLDGRDNFLLAGEVETAGLAPAILSISKLVRDTSTSSVFAAAPPAPRLAAPPFPMAQPSVPASPERTSRAHSAARVPRVRKRTVPNRTMRRGDFVGERNVSRARPLPSPSAAEATFPVPSPSSPLRRPTPSLLFLAAYGDAPRGLGAARPTLSSAASVRASPSGDRDLPASKSSTIPFGAQSPSTCPRPQWAGGPRQMNLDTSRPPELVNFRVEAPACRG